MSPYQTLNHALDVVYDLKFPGPGIELGNPIVIHVWHREGFPIAPWGFGGTEGGPLLQGWRTPEEQASGCVRKVLPIRLVKGVVVVGISTGGVKPAIIIDESSTGSNGTFYTEWAQPGSCATEVPRSIVLAATDSSINGFRIDGSLVVNTFPPFDQPGVFVPAVQGFEINDCEIRAWHDEVCIDPGGEGNIASIAISASILADAWPLLLNHGHAGLWIRGRGNTSLTLTNGTVFSGSHDAIETDLESPTSRGEITATNTSFIANENGFEVVGAGQMDVVLDTCLFKENFHRPGGFPKTDGPVYAVLFQGSCVASPVIQNCEFLSNSFAVAWRLANTGGSTLEMGRDGSPGLNSFCLDYGINFLLPGDPYCACLGQFTSAPMYAAGNYWLPGNQGTSGGSDRTITLGPVLGPMNNNLSLLFPDKGCESTPGQQIPRNFVIIATALGLGAIDFGMLPPSFVPAPPPCLPCQNM